MARFTFPANPQSSVLINAGGSAHADDFSDVQIDPAANEISGSASSGLFCSQRPRYKVYFSAVFDRPFGSYGTWTRQQLDQGSTAASDSQSPRKTPAPRRRRGPTRPSTRPPTRS